MSPQPLTIDVLREAVATGAAFRCRTVLQPAGGPGDKVFPPTYAEAVYAVEQRRLPNYEEPVTCVLLDSVQSQANRMEEALQDAVDEGRIALPVIEVDFSKAELLDPIDRVTSLQAPHRVADAILRDSLLDGQPFRYSKKGKELDRANARNVTPLFELCPTALLFGMWDSTGPKGGLGTKFARAMVSEIIGIDASFGTKTSSRIDPLQIAKNAGPLYRRPDKGWTLDPAEALDEMRDDKPTGKKILFRKGSKGKDVYFDPTEDKAKCPDEGRPSVANHGNFPPSLSNVVKTTGMPLAGGVTVASAEQLTVLSLPALRRLCFPPKGQTWKPSPEQKARDEAGRTVLAALGLCAAALAAEKGLDLRSRCLLCPEHELKWELLGQPGSDPVVYEVNAKVALVLLKEAVEGARVAGLSWRVEPLVLKPSPQLVALVKKSQELAVAAGAEGGEEG